MSRVVRAGRPLGNASRPPNRNVIDPQILSLGSIVPHVVIEADFIDLQIRSCAPAHALLNDLPLAVNPQLLAAVVLAGVFILMWKTTCCHSPPSSGIMG